jgi:hypothetical protein
MNNGNSNCMAGMAGIVSLLAFLLTGNVPAHAGVLTAPISWLFVKTTQSETKEVATAAVSRASKGARELLVRDGVEAGAQSAESKLLTALALSEGEQAAKATAAVACRMGIQSATVAREVTKYVRVYRRAGFAEQAIEFGFKHGDAGRFFVNRPELLGALKNSGVLEKGSREIVEESWNLVRGSGGSWQRLRTRLTESGLNNGVGRDFCETLFVNRARAGGIPGMLPGTELVSGHIGKGRQGIDFLLPEKGGRLRVIEFGTGAKPSRPGEMSFEHIRNQLAGFMENASPDMKVNLRGQGVDPHLFDPSRLRDPRFSIERYVQREIYATEANSSLLDKLGADVRFVELP